MASNIGEMIIGLKFDGKTLDTSINGVKQKLDNAGEAGAGFGSKLKMAGAVAAAGVAAAGAAIVKVTKDAVSAYANYEQLVGGVETLFKDSANIVQDYAKQAYKTAGLSANQYMETVTSFSASLLQGLGGDTAKAAQYGNRAVIDMADNANKMGTDIGRIQDAYQGFAKQNYTMLDNLKLGYGGTKTEMERLLKDAEKLSGKKFDVSNFADITEAIHIVQESMGIAGTTAQEAEDTISGSLNMVKASWQNVLVSLAGGGDDIRVVLNQFMSSIQTFAKNVIPVITQVLQNIPKLIEIVGNGIITELPKLIETVVPPLLAAAIEIVAKLLEYAPQILIALVNGATMLVQQLAARLPQMIGVIVSALTNPTMLTQLLQAGLQLFMALVMAIPDIIIALAEAIPTIIDNIVTFISNPENIMMIFNAMVKVMMALVQAIPRVLPPLLKALGALLSSLPRQIIGYASALAGAFGQIMQKGVDKVKGFVGKMMSAAGDLINGLLKGIGNGAKAVVNKIKDICKGALDAVKNFFGIKSPSRVMAQMGDFLMQGFEKGIEDNTSAVVNAANDANSEIMSAFGGQASTITADFDANSSIERNIMTSVLSDDYGRANGIGDRNIVVNMTNNIDNRLDAQEIGSLMMTSIRRAV